MMAIEGGPYQALTITLQPIGAGFMPTTRMAFGTPVVAFGDFPARVEVLLGNVDDPADFLRRLARTLTAFAHEVDVAREQRMPEATR